MSLSRPRRTAAALLSVALLGGGLAGCSRDSVGGSGDQGYVAGKGIITSLKVADRKRPGPVAGTTLAGRNVSLSDYRGKVVVLNVWGSWCPPCRKEAPDLVAAAKELGPTVQFIGLNTRDLDPAPARKFVQEFGVQYPSIYDPNGKALLRFRGQISPKAIPTTLVIDKSGKVAARVVGEVSKDTLLGMVHDAAAG